MMDILLEEVEVAEGNALKLLDGVSYWCLLLL